jgi:hypothetical protein
MLPYYLHPIITRLVDEETFKKMGAEHMSAADSATETALDLAA